MGSSSRSLFTLALLIFPIRTRIIRSLLLVGTGATVLLVILIFAKGRACWAIASVFVAALGLLSLPGDPPDKAALRQEYVQSLASYEDVRYLWGSETSIAIDCSGLVRRGLMDATLKQGIKTLNPRLLRASFSLWWRDLSEGAGRGGDWGGS